jgi:hypothetical protein
MTAFIAEIEQRSAGALWNNGDFVVRNMRGKESLSVHATGRAVDVSWRHIQGTGKGAASRGIRDGGRQAAIQMSRLLIRNADLLGLELILDYYPTPHGRGWRCDRREWIRYEVPTVSGAPGGDWLHIEISPMLADDATAMRAAWSQVVPLDN